MKKWGGDIFLMKWGDNYDFFRCSNRGIFLSLTNNTNMDVFNHKFI